MLSRYEQFTSVISTIHRCVQKIERDEMVKYGYKGSFAQYLAAINRHPDGVTAAQLSEICDKDKAAISRAVSEMEEGGLVQRKGDGESMYRARLYLTAEGLRLAEIVSERGRVAVDLAGSGLNDAERVIFYATLERIAGNLHKLGRDGLPKDNSKEN